MIPSLSNVDYIIIGTYMVFALAVGFILSKKASESSENYFLGGRNLPWWLVGISMVATSYASDTPLAITEIIREHGIQRVWWFLSSCIGSIVGMILFARLWRRAEITTDAEYLELRYSGRPAAVLRAFKAFQTGILTNLIQMAGVTLAMSSVITAITDINRWIAISVCITVALVYSVFSGFYGVVVTDLVQFFIAVFGMVYLAVVSWNKVGGFDVIFEKVSHTAGHGPETFDFFPSFSNLNLELFALFIFIGVVWWNDSGGYLMQRMSSCKDETHSVKAAIFNAVFQTSRMWIWAGVAIVTVVLFPDLGDTGYTETQAYPMVMNTYLPIGLKGILVTAFLAAYMSTIDTHLNWGASYIMTDVYRRFIKKEATEKHYMKITRLVVVLLMFAAACLVPFMKSVSMSWEFFFMVGAGIGLISVLRWFWWRVSAYTELTVLLTSLALAVFSLLCSMFWPDITLLGYIWTEVPFEIKIALFTAISVPLGLIVTYLTPPVPIEQLEYFFRKVKPGGFWGILSPEITSTRGSAIQIRTLIDIIAGLMLCFGLSLAIGYLFFGNISAVIFCMVMAVVGGLWVYGWYKREVKELSHHA